MSLSPFIKSIKIVSVAAVCFSIDSSALLTESTIEGVCVYIVARNFCGKSTLPLSTSISEANFFICFNRSELSGPPPNRVFIFNLFVASAIIGSCITSIL